MIPTVNGRRLTLSAAFLTAALAGAPATAWNVDLVPDNNFGGAVPGWSISDSGSLYAEWNIFTPAALAPPGDCSPDVGSIGPAPQCVAETTGTAFVTSGGNIYSFAFATAFEVDIGGPTAEPLGERTVALRLQTLGTSVDPASVLLAGQAPTLISNPFSGEITGGFGGGTEEWLFSWTGFSDQLLYDFSFASEISSMSLARLAVYASPVTIVPIPAAVWLFASGLGLLSFLRRRAPSVGDVTS